MWHVYETISLRVILYDGRIVTQCIGKNFDKNNVYFSLHYIKEYNNNNVKKFTR